MSIGQHQVIQNGYDDYGLQNRNPGYISGQVRPGEAVSIGNGRRHTNVVAINSAGDSDYYVGNTDGGVNTNNGYDQGYPTEKGQGQSGIIANKRPDGQDDVLLWNANGKKQSSIAVNNDGTQLYSGTQNGYASQGTNQNVIGQDQVIQNGYDGYGQQNRNPGYISGQVRPGETVSIGNGRGRTNVVAINSAGDSDHYVGYTDGGVNTNTGYDQGYPTKKGQDSGATSSSNPRILLSSLVAGIASILLRML
ncbi:uncharacterized protein LOC125061571 isoform X1 [Pieris napi]|uniref:uncharacterized protein LOC125061571 isoform X1 n=1 Tax=Pieris napi TaxID=78633 RepID=UPI001FBAF9F3|nr:uncharacterized protein LOC125061571 isoform X1 [Pieris napi]